jgi:hypothetical protein
MPERGQQMLIVRVQAAVAVVVLSAGTAAAQDPPRGDASSALSKCPVAESAQYGYSMDQPVEVGGGAMYVAARERRYLDALRGPAGEPVQYKRRGSTSPSPNSLIILDAYEVTYAGLEKPVTIYLNAYHYDDRLRAPQGFTCGTPIALAPPGADLFLVQPELIAFALEQGASRQFDPIPLTTAGVPKAGVILDQFRIVAAEAHAAAASGAPLKYEANPTQRPPAALRQRFVVVTYPLPCEGRSVPVKSIAIVPPPNGAPLPHQGEFASGAALQSLVPGLTAPDGSLAATFSISTPRPRDAIRITYAEACGGVSEVSVPIEYTGERPRSFPEPAMPAGVAIPPATVYLQVLVDPDGKLQRPLHIGGPKELLPAALEAIKSWTAEPARVNGAPIVKGATVGVRFTPPAR